jgi:aminomethyltransferase
MADDTLLRTPLHHEHVALGAKMVPFAGFSMPVHYPAGITAEHHAVRRAAGLFDVSHMGEFVVTGPDAERFVQYVTTNDVSVLEVGQAQYSTLPDERGRLLDDLLVYRFEDRWMLVVNGSNRARDLAWLRSRVEGFDVVLDDRSDETALLALQGPRAQEILAPLASVDLDGIRYYRFVEGSIDGIPATISRTGYTGEDGFELYVPAAGAAELWRRLLEAGRGAGLVPAGLGCRDSLRLEMGYALYGNDLDEDTSPLEAGLGWVVKLDAGDFVGRDALAREREGGVGRKLVGFRLRERGFPRHGYRVLSGGEAVGTVTSGVLGPTVGAGIGMAYVPAALARVGTELEIEIRGSGVPAEVVRPPFHTGGSVRKG